MSEILIKQANNNNERQETYRYLIGRYKMSVKTGFYFEALMIVYAMQEDRLKSVLFYSGVFENRNKVKLSKKTKDGLQFILQNKYGASERFSLTTITGKIKLLESLLYWTESANEEDEQYSEYLVSVKHLFESIDIDALRETLEKLKEWLQYRNEIMHAAMNKNITELYEGMEEKVELGMEYARELDANVKILKKENCVRKKLNMSRN
jgi:hypothetical protein